MVLCYVFFFMYNVTSGVKITDNPFSSLKKLTFMRLFVSKLPL